MPKTKTMKRMKGKRNRLYLRYRRLMKAARIADDKMLDAYVDWLDAVNKDKFGT